MNQDTTKMKTQDEIYKKWDKAWHESKHPERDAKFHIIEAMNEYAMQEAEKKVNEVLEWTRVRFQNAPLEFDNYWEDMEGFPNESGKSYTSAELYKLFKDKT